MEMKKYVINLMSWCYGKCIYDVGQYICFFNDYE